MKNFQIIVIVTFSALAILGVLVFSGAIPLGGNSDQEGQGSVVLWGTFPASIMTTILEESNNAHPTYNISYVEKSPSTLDRELLEALASGVGPDIILLPDDLVYQYRDKLFTIPYENFPLANFRATFAAAGEVFLNSSGILAFPMTIDPLMMYYNRTMFDAAGIVYPPATWADLANITPSLVKKDESGNLTKAAVAMGHFVNVSRAKDILTTLFLQAGSPVVKIEDGRISPALADYITNLGPTLKFYTDFADPAQSVYSWNRIFPNSTDAFSREDLAIYFGLASELSNLQSRNPNHNFSPAPMPQFTDSNNKATKAKVVGIAISRFSQNFNTAYIAANTIATSNFAAQLANAMRIPPARRDLLAQRPSDAYGPIFYSSAIFARNFVDPEPEEVYNIFRAMVESVLSGGVSPSDAIRDANSKMGLLFR